MKILSIGSLAEKLLEGGEKAQLVSVLTRTAYARTDSGELVAFTTAKQRAPWSMNLSPLEVTLPSIFHEGETAQIRGQRLLIGNAIAELDSRSVYEGLSSVEPTEEISSRVLRAKRLLSLLDLSRSILDGNDTFLVGARQRLARLASALMQNDLLLAQMLVNGVLGLGRGFTPSADDFLVGLFGFYHQAYRRQVALVLPDQTPWVSRKMVEYSMSGLLIEDAARLISSLLSGTLEDTSRAVADLVGIGHTSGIDICAGVIEGAEIRPDQLELSAVAVA